jgi:TM2 domain-containing membrane protein YozV
MKNPGLAAVISLFISGGGQMYAGYITRGFLILGTCILAPMIVFAVSSISLLAEPSGGAGLGIGAFGWVIMVVLWVWQVYDAYNLARVTPSSS